MSARSPLVLRIPVAKPSIVVPDKVKTSLFESSALIPTVELVPSPTNDEESS